MDACDDSGGWAGWLSEQEASRDETSTGWLDRIAGMVLERARIASGDTVADIGAGAGLLAVEAARMAGPRGKVIAIDSSAACLAAARAAAQRSRATNLSTIQGRIEELPLEDSSCDAVVCRSALIYTSDISRAVGEIRRVLAQGGRYSVFEPLAGELEWRMPEGLGGHEDDFAMMERTLKEKRASYSIKRTTLREAFTVAGLEEPASLVVHFRIALEGKESEDIQDEYLHDLPGELAALSVLRGAMEEERIVEAAGAFARFASEGKVSGVLPSMFIWSSRSEE